MFNSLDHRIDIKLHPKYHIVINNVSKYGEDYDIDAIEKNPDMTTNNTATNLSVDKRITDIKSQLIESAILFYLSEEISENTRIGSKIWKDIKDEVCKDDFYKEASWFMGLKEHDQTLISDLKQI